MNKSMKRASKLEAAIKLLIRCLVKEYGQSRVSTTFSWMTAEKPSRIHTCGGPFEAGEDR